jgi:hypothetical protein
MMVAGIRRKPKNRQVAPPVQSGLFKVLLIHGRLK